MPKNDDARKKEEEFKLELVRKNQEERARQLSEERRRQEEERKRQDESKKMKE